jgi:hypothetical protein
VRIKHAYEVFASLGVDKEGFEHIADEDKRAWNDGEGEVGVGDEVSDVLLEGE